MALLKSNAYCSQPVIASWKEAVIASHPLPLENSTSSFSTFYILRELLFPSTATSYINIRSVSNTATTQSPPLPLKSTSLFPAPNCYRPSLLNAFLRLFLNILKSCDFERCHDCERGLGFSQNSLIFPMPAFFKTHTTTKHSFPLRCSSCFLQVYMLLRRIQGNPLYSGLLFIQMNCLKLINQSCMFS